MIRCCLLGEKEADEAGDEKENKRLVESEGGREGGRGEGGRSRQGPTEGSRGRSLLFRVGSRMRRRERGNEGGRALSSSPLECRPVQQQQLQQRQRFHPRSKRKNQQEGRKKTETQKKKKKKKKKKGEEEGGSEGGKGKRSKDGGSSALCVSGMGICCLDE